MTRSFTFWALVLGVISALLQIYPTPISFVVSLLILMFHINTIHILVLMVAVLLDAAVGRLPRACMLLPPIALAAYGIWFAQAYFQSRGIMTEVAAAMASRN